MTFAQVIPKQYKNIINYQRSIDNNLIVTITVTPPAWRKETLSELSDSNHKNAIRQARLEYQRGETISERQFMANLKK